MDKYELKVTISEIDSLISKRRFREAAEVADSVDWRRVKNVRTLCRISDVYKVNRRYHDSKRVLELAYAKSPYGRQIIFSLCELELKLGNYVRALQLYNEYINVAPRDADRYVLQYKLYKAQNVSVNERIAVLEDLAKHDFRDKWAYELAKLYLEAGERTLCASECDEIIAFFGYGRYVYKALELKASFTELTVKQKALFRKMNGEEEEEEESSAESGSTPDAETIRIPARSDSPEADAEKEAARGEDSNDTGEEPDLDTGKEQVRASEEGTDLSETEQDKEDGQAQESPAADESGDSESGQAPEPAQKEEMIPALNREPAAEIPWEYEDYRISPGELKKKPAKKSRDNERGQADSSAGRPDKQKMPARSGTTAPAPAADHAVFEDRSFEVSSVEESIFSQERMQETIAKGLRNLENYDPYLRQETDGQYAMVIQEDPKPEKQITGQLNLEEIMTEWEKVKRDFYEYNGLEDDAPPQKPSVSMKKAPNSDVNKDDTGSTKSWDPGEVHKALEIRDNEEESAGFDTSLFVTEGGGAFPKEFAVEQMTLTRTDGKGSKGQMYLHSEDSIRQLTDALDRIFLEGGRGNVVITGDEGAGTLSLARELVLRYRRKNPNFVGQIAKSEGRYITRENVLRVIPRMPFGALIIERASMMSEEGAAALCEMIAVPERSILIIMIDRKGVMDAFLNDHPRMKEMFPARVDIAALSVDTLLGYAREYAGKLQCEIDEYGISALESRIMSMQTVDHSVTLEDIRDIVDEALYYASRKTISSLVDSFSRRKAGAQRIILRDKDFLHY
ncbi:MAG: hypothetical protein IJ126_09085 [Lachnospiraceae bacterium]|nr:hypothetical protein [Lachnospiraceae bacterium]